MATKAKKTTAKKAAAKQPAKKKTAALKKKTVAKKAAAPKKASAKKSDKTAKKVAAKKAEAAKAAKSAKTTKSTPAAKTTAKKATTKKVATKAAPVKTKTSAKKAAVAKPAKAEKKPVEKKAAPKKAEKVEKVDKKVAKKAVSAAKPAKEEKIDKKVKAKKKPERILRDHDDFIDDNMEDMEELEGLDAFEDDLDFEEKPQKKFGKGSNKEIAELETKINDEILTLSENFSWEEVADAISTLDFFVDHRSDECLEKGCDNLRTTQQYCRLHYVANWYDIKKKREILKEGKLQEYIEELISKYPASLIETIVQDLQDDKDFYRALHELNITSDFEMDEDAFEGVDDDDDSDEDIAVETRAFTNHRYDDDQ